MGHCLCGAMLVAWWLSTLDVVGRVLVRVSKGALRRGGTQRFDDYRSGKMYRAAAVCTLDLVL
jgi:hypothetical protein